MTLEQFFLENPEVAIAFSGGTDSSYLLYEASKHAKKVHAYYLNSPFQPEFEHTDACRLAKQLNIPLTVVSFDILTIPDVIANDAKRCYYCKTTLFTHLKKLANNDGFTVLLDGTNASDNADDRPGMKALQELGVRSPLRECGLTKDIIRQNSAQADLFTSNKPAYACLATRIPCNTTITKERLERVEKGEEILFSFGFSDFRIRLFHDSARIQLPLSQMNLLLEKRTDIIEALSPYFKDIMLDLIPRP